MNVHIKKISPDAVIPTYGTASAAGADLYACISDDIVIGRGETVIIPTGIAMAIPKGYAGFIFARSGLASKRGIAPANKVGVIDSDYRGEILVALHNHGKNDKVIVSGERIAQIVIMPIVQAEFNVTDELDETARGDGGFGSTGSM